MSKVFEALEHAAEEKVPIARLNLEIASQRRTRQTEEALVTSVRSMEPEMRRLHQSLSSRIHDPSKKVFLFVSANSGEGTSTIVREFGQLLAETQKKSVLLLDYDPQHITQHQSFGIQPQKGLFSNVGGWEGWRQAVSQVPHSRISLSLVFDRYQEDSPADQSVAHEEIWSGLRKEFDTILIDSPAGGVSEDAFSLCLLVDGVILVLEAESTRSQVVANTKNRIIQSGGNILGVVFNKQRQYIPEWVYKRL